MKYSKATITDDAEKAALMRRMSKEDRELLFLYDEDPKEYLPQETRILNTGQNRYLVLVPYSYDDFSEWLCLGNWQAISPGIETCPFIDSFRNSVEAVQAHLLDYNVSVMIDSFHDNIEWDLYWKL